MDAFVAKGLAAKRESKFVEFKDRFDPTSKEAWCEIIKDVIAISNSGGGVIVIGLNSDGTPSGNSVADVIALDPAQVTDRITKYTGSQFTDFEISECNKDGSTFAAIRIFEAADTIVFENPGTYDIGGGKQKTAFSKGTVYFRHGAKSEPGNADDLRAVLKRRVDSVRREWLQGMRKVVSAKPGSKVSVLPPEVIQSDSADASPIRIVDDPEAPAYRLVDPDVTHPHRQKEVVNAVNSRLPRGTSINAHDILAVRRVFGVDSREEFCHKSKFGSPQYSAQLVDWIVREFQQNHDFFTQARDRYRRHDF